MRTMRAAGSQVVHYTSAANAVSIIRGRTLWLRNAKLMNDFSEIDYGRWCVTSALDTLTAEWSTLLDGLVTGLAQEVRRRFDRLEGHRLSHTYVLSLSEHLASENDMGRLSMWRAYGVGGGVAMIFDPSVFDQEPTGMNIYSTVVLYTNADGFTLHLREVLAQMQRERATIVALPPETLADALATFLHYAVLSTKHPSFAEEREIRLITGVSDSEIATKSIEVVRGVPQVVWKLPLQDRPERNYSADLRRMLNRVIVGPVAQPPIVHEALQTVLAEEGFPNPPTIVHTSWLPLRSSL